MPARCTAAALLALSASLQPPVPRRTHLKRHASTDDAALLDAYRAEIAPDAADDWWREFVAATERPPRPAVRCVDAAAAAALRASTECEEIPWAPGRGYWLNEEPSKRVAHVAGDYYVQEAAAMVAVAALLRGEDLRRRVVAIDACAAPGGKTIQLATALRDAGADAVVVANEPSSSRLGALVANAVRCGVGPWLRCTRTTGQKLFAALPRECADFILLDAPCSGDTLARREGRGLAKHLRGQPDAASMKEIVATQLEIVRAAWPCLRPGGALVYATCSLRPREDEEVVHQVLKEFGDAAVEDLAGLAAGGEGATLRLWPQTHDSAGFFAAKLRKAGDGGGAAVATDADEDVADAARDYLRDAWGVTSLVGPASSRLVGRGANLWLAPAAPPLAKNLRYERAGAKLVEALKVRGKAVPLGQALRSGRVRATHEFATTLGGHVDAARRASLDDASALAYLRGDDVDAAPPSGEPGDQCLVAHGGRVLGLAKVLKGGRLKNQLPRECVRRDLAF